MLGILTYFHIRCGSCAPAERELPSLATFFTSLLERGAAPTIYVRSTIQVASEMTMIKRIMMGFPVACSQ